MATQSDQTNTGVVTTIVVVGAFAMISIGAMVTAMVRAEHAKVDSERPTNADLETVAALDKSQLARLTAPPAWVADPGGKVHIPIERAMKLVVEEYRKDPAAASPPPPPGLNMAPPAPSDPGAVPGAPPAAPGAAPVGPSAAPAAPGAAPNIAAPGTPQPTPAAPSPAKPGPAAPDPKTTQRVVPPPAAPGPPATPAPAGRP